MFNTSLEKDRAKTGYAATARAKNKRERFKFNKLTAVIVMPISSIVSLLVIRWLFLVFA